MARDLDSIIKELDAGYDPARRLINERISAQPAQADAEIQGLRAQEQDYYDNNIMAGARQRGIGFSGIPIGERAKYGATQFLPAVARVKQAQTDQRSSLLEALNNTNIDQRTRALSIYQQELDRDEQQRQFNEQLAAQERERERQARASAAASAFSPTMGGLGGRGGGVTDVKAGNIAIDEDYNYARTAIDNKANLRAIINTQKRFLNSKNAPAKARAEKLLGYFQTLLGNEYQRFGG